MSGMKLTVLVCLFTIWLIIMQTFEAGFAIKINLNNDTKRRDDIFMRKINQFMERISRQPLNILSTPQPGFPTNRPMNSSIENQMRQIIQSLENLTEFLRRNIPIFRQPRSLWNETHRLQPRIMFDRISMKGFNSTQFQGKITKFKLFLLNLKKSIEEKLNLKNRTTIVPRPYPSWTSPVPTTPISISTVSNMYPTNQPSVTYPTSTPRPITMPPFPSTIPTRITMPPISTMSTSMSTMPSITVTQEPIQPFSSTIQPTVTYPWEQSTITPINASTTTTTT